MTFGKNKLSNTISKNQYYSSYCYYSCFFRFRPIRFELLKKRILRQKYVRKYSTDDRTLATPIVEKKAIYYMFDFCNNRVCSSSI